MRSSELVNSDEEQFALPGVLCAIRGALTFNVRAKRLIAPRPASTLVAATRVTYCPKVGKDQPPSESGNQAVMTVSIVLSLKPLPPSSMIMRVASALAITYVLTGSAPQSTAPAAEPKTDRTFSERVMYILSRSTSALENILHAVIISARL